MLRLLTRLALGFSIENRAGLPKVKLALLYADLRKLRKKGATLPEKLLRYAVDGEGEEVLLALGGKEGCGQALGLVCCPSATFLGQWGRKTRRQRLLDGLKVDDPAFHLRLARIWEAAARQEHPALSSQHVQGFPAWLEVFLQEVRGFRMVVIDGERETYPLSAQVVEGMLGAAGEDLSAAVRALLVHDPSDPHARRLAYLAEPLADMGESIARYPEVVVEALKQKQARQRVNALETLAKCQAPSEPFAEQIVTLAVSSAKTAREAARPLTNQLSGKIAPLVRARCEEGEPPERLHAVQLLWELEKDDAIPFFRERREAETSRKVIEAIDGILAGPKVGAGRKPAEASELPPPQPECLPDVPVVTAVDPQAPATQEVKDDFAALLRSIADEAKAHHDKETGDEKRYRQPPSLPPMFEAQAARQLEGLVVKKRDHQPLLRLYGPTTPSAMQKVKRFLEHPDLEPIHAVRVCVMLGMSVYYGWGERTCFLPTFEELINHYRRTHGSQFGLRELAAAVAAVGLSPDGIGETKLTSPRALAFNWEPEAVWPYFAERRHILETIFGMRPAPKVQYDWYRTTRRRNAFRVLALFPSLPPEFVTMLWGLALEGGKTDRPLAQEALHHVVGKEERIVQALSSGKQETRATAAEWLAQLKHREAVPAIKAALGKEKQELARAALMSALEAMGEPIDEFIDRDGLLGEAEKGLKKGIPDALSWFPFDLLPQVTWQDTGQPADRQVLTWLVVRSHKLKDPAPGPLLRRHCALFKPAERDALGLFVLQSWIQQDTIPAHTREEATQLAETRAKHAIKQPWCKGITVEELTRANLAELLKEVKGSAIKEKGILAVAAACGSSQLVPVVERYLKEWYGMRAAQCRALVQMLAWIEAPTATQLLLSVATRFRTKGIQDEADNQVKLLAERKGWSTDELADRTIPTAGLDEDGELALACGERTYTARLSPEFRLAIHNEQGKEVKGLPAPKGAKDPDAVKQAKKVLSQAKRELKSVVQMQKTRLFENMCTQRTWRFADWQQYLNRHPIVKRYCEGLVWCEVDEGQLKRTFRPLADGTLTDLADDELTVPDDASVRLAHSTVVPRELGEAWLRHFEDYEVTPLFTQFGGEQYVLPDEGKDETEVTDFEGHLIEAYKLRSEAQRRDYVRAQAEDGGWFYMYRKDFPSLELRAMIEFSGSPLPEENRLVALNNLQFVSSQNEAEEGYGIYGSGGFAMPLGEIPPVLLSECYNDLKQIAAAGIGFDPDWEKKVGW
jgi:hypothetical protein